MNDIQKAINEIKRYQYDDLLCTVSDETCNIAIQCMRQNLDNKWIPCKDRLPTEEECTKQGSNLFEVTVVVRNKFRVTDYCLLHTDYKTWHVKDDSEVVAWRYKVEPYMG